MTNRDDLIDQLHEQSRNQAHLAVIATATSVAEMHIDLALFSAAQAQIAEDVCEVARWLGTALAPTAVRRLGRLDLNQSLNEEIIVKS